MRSAQTRVVRLYPSFGELCFFEVPFTNGADAPARFNVIIADDCADEVGPELRLVTDPARTRSVLVLFLLEPLPIR